MRGVQWEDEHDHGTVAHTVHTISPHYTAPADDISSKRYELGSGLRDLFQERQFTDLTLEVDGRRWEVHRVVLGSCSLFLEQLLQGRPASGDPLVLTGLNVEGMELLIDWAYGKYKRRLGYQQRLSMIRASHRLEVHDLLLECEKALKNSVNSETHPLLADLAREFNCQELEQACEAFVVRMESSSDTVEAAKELRSRVGKEQALFSQASSSRPSSPSQDPPASQGPSNSADSDCKSQKCKPLNVELDLEDLDYDWCPAGEAVSGAVTGQQSPGIGAKQIAVPQPSGSTRECNCFPVDVDDSDEEDYDDGITDDDITDDDITGDGITDDDITDDDDDDDIDNDDSDVDDDDTSSVHETEDECISNGPVHLLDLAGAPSSMPSAHAAAVSQEPHQEPSAGLSLEAVPQDEQQGEQLAAGGDAVDMQGKGDDQPEMPATQQHTFAPLQDLGFNSGSTSGQHVPPPASRGWRYKLLYAVGEKIDSARAVKRNWFRPKRSTPFHDDPI